MTQARRPGLTCRLALRRRADAWRRFTARAAAARPTHHRMTTALISRIGVRTGNDGRVVRDVCFARRSLKAVAARRRRAVNAQFTMTAAVAIWVVIDAISVARRSVARGVARAT